MKCMVCGQPTVFTYRIQNVEAAFCPYHLPREQPRANAQKIIVTISLSVF
jgi:recombinational DNA repair protein (RecF pathway)